MGGHTKGPWVWALDRQNQPECLRQSGSGDVVANAQADISDYGLSVNPWIDVSEQDARLIAAAPDLLEALRSLVDDDLTYNGASVIIPAESHGDALERVRKARAAIAKAEQSA